ncbi:NAD-dependent protein deacetylase sirtuin-7 [Balamuthia mandrillaris]
MEALLAGIRNFNKRKLADVETVVKTTPTAVLDAQDEAEPSERSSFRWHFGHEQEEDKIEWFDEPQAFRKKCERLAQLIKKAKRVVVYTGAGISTAAKLPDYRGSDGMWTNRDQGTALQGSYLATISQALPTLSHMAVAELVRRKKLHFVVSTNVDGLHMRSGLQRSVNLAELHGNSYLETCNKCGKAYLRPQDVLQRQTTEHRAVDRHWCGALCEEEGCDGLLLDTIVAFGETLPEDQLALADKESRKGDLAIVLGSTMMVEPACSLPLQVLRNGGKMIICNLQRTPYDQQAEFLIRGHLDDVWHLVMKELGVEIPFTTPEGLKIPEYEEDIDRKHEEKREECRKKMAEIEREKRENPASRGNALTRGENPYQRKVISGTNEERDLTFPSLQLAFFHRCKGSVYRVLSKTKKIVLENCQDTTIIVDGKVLTNMLEVINSQNIKLVLNTPVLTVTCDNVDRMSLEYADKDNFQMIAWAQVKEAAVKIAGEEVDMSALERIDREKDQLITRRTEEGAIQSSVTRRDHCGRITELVCT